MYYLPFRLVNSGGGGRGQSGIALNNSISLYTNCSTISILPIDFTSILQYNSDLYGTGCQIHSVHYVN